MGGGGIQLAGLYAEKKTACISFLPTRRNLGSEPWKNVGQVCRCAVWQTTKTSQERGMHRLVNKPIPCYFLSVCTVCNV